MAAGYISTRTSTQAQTKVLEKTYSLADKKIPPLYTELFNVITPEMRRSVSTWLPTQEIGTLEYKAEGGAPVYKSPQELIPYSATYATFALAVKATEEAELEDPNQFSAKIPAQLAVSERESKDLTIWSTVNLAFNANFLGTDGQPLCSTAHLLGPVATPLGLISSIGATFSNSLGATALTPEALQSMYILFETLLTDAGLPSRRTPVDLWVSPYLAKIGQEVLGSPKAPYSNDNRVNPLYGTVNLKVCRYFTSQWAWFVTGNKGDPFSGEDCHQLFAAYKWQNRYKAWRDGETDNYNQKSSFRYTYGFGGWRGFGGSQGVPQS